MHNNIVHRFRRILHQPPGKTKPVFHAAAPEARFCRGDFNRCGDKAHDIPIMRYARRDRLFGKCFQARFLLHIRCGCAASRCFCNVMCASTHCRCSRRKRRISRSGMRKGARTITSPARVTSTASVLRLLRLRIYSAGNPLTGESSHHDFSQGFLRWKPQVRRLHPHPAPPT